MSIGFFLKAENSSGTQRLYIDYKNGDIFFCLTGEHEGETLQIDFDPFSADEAQELVDLIQRRVNAAKSYTATEARGR